MKLKEAYRLYRLLQQNESLKNKRHPMFEKNRFMNVLVWFMFLYYGAILLFMGVILPMGLRGRYCDVAAFHVFDGFFPWLLICDFWVRFVLQETPAQRAKPYALLPIRRTFLMHMYLGGNIFALGNLFWGFLLIPFGALAVMPILGWASTFSWWMGWWMMIAANGLLYLFCRSLCIRHLAWTLLPAAIHGAIIALMTVPSHNPLDMPCTLFLYQFSLCRLWPYLVLLALITLLYLINYKMQMSATVDEIGKKEEVTVKSTTQMNFLNRFGAMGEYLKLEIKLRLRNKPIRIQFFTLLGVTCLLCGIQYFTNIYDNSFMSSFICLYAYIAFGGTALAMIMSHEGNYIDGLMSRRESIYDLLCAKYYFNVAILFVPFLILLPGVIEGKITIWMNLAYLSFTAGIIYAGLFQLAVYNRETLPLNVKVTGQKGNTQQQIASMVMIFLPVGIEQVCSFLVGQTPTHLFMTGLGLVGIATHRHWIGNIYKRFMKRRHYNMEGMRASRN